MAILTADEFVQQMIAQARLLDPSISLEIGTPERKMFDVFASALAANQVDLTGLSSALDVDSKFGGNLDQFTQMFGFERAAAQTATGYVVFSRNSPAPTNIIIPSGVVVQANVTSGTDSDSTVAIQYVTTASGSIAINQTLSGAVPIRATITGAIGNTDANTITVMSAALGGSTVSGVTSVTNPNALTNGADAEDDNSFKVRFKNTWARNLAGTQDQYLALAVNSGFTTKANVMGIQSRYQEYIQVPNYDDAGWLAGVQTASQITFGAQGQWTTALSVIPYAKQVYTTTPAFVTNGQSGAAQFFYRASQDFNFNYPPVISGDALRNSVSTTATAGATLPTGTLTVASTTGFPTSGTIMIGATPISSTLQGELVSYTGKTATTFTGCTGGVGIVAIGALVYLVPTGTQPNFTFLNVFNANTSPAAGLQAVAPGNLVLSEFSYISSASRNDLTHNVNNAVDVYVDGNNDTAATSIFLPNLGSTVIFSSNTNSAWYYENYRRAGQPTKRPLLGNYISPLFNAPVDGLPATITVNNQNYYLGYHYWLVQEIGPLGGSARARDGIEWNWTLGGDTGGQLPPTDPTLPYAPTGATIQSLSTTQAVEVDNYLFDANIITLQASLEAAKQISTDVLAHRAFMRYFKLDITIIYSPNSNYAVVNAAIGTAVQAFFDRQYFGTIIQLSDLLEVIHEVPGVDNVRWSDDLSPAPDKIRVLETDRNGNPLHGVTVDRKVPGGAAAETQTLYIVGSPSGQVGTTIDYFTLSWVDASRAMATRTTAAIPFLHTDGTTVTASDIQTAIRTAMPTGIGLPAQYVNVTVTEDSRPTIGVVTPIRSFTLTFSSTGAVTLPTVINTITQSQYTYNADFFLLDNELPTLPQAALSTDTGGIPGLIIRPRAQNTFYRSGLG